MDDPFTYVLGQIDFAERARETSAKSGSIGISAFEAIISQGHYRVYDRNGVRMVNFEAVFFKLDTNLDRWAVQIEQFYRPGENKWEESEKQFAEFAGYPKKTMELQHEDIFG